MSLSCLISSLVRAHTPAECYRAEFAEEFARYFPGAPLVELSDSDVQVALAENLAPCELMGHVARQVAFMQFAVETVAEVAEAQVCVCIGCGCTDVHACHDTVIDRPCYWMRVDRATGTGVCSCCEAYLGLWDDGLRHPLQSPEQVQMAAADLAARMACECGADLLPEVQP